MVVSPSEITLTLGHPGLSLLASASPRFVWLSNWAGPVKDLNIFIICFSRWELVGTNDLHQWKDADPPHVVLLLPQSPCQLEGFENPAAPSVLAGVELEQWKAGDQARVD